MILFHNCYTVKYESINFYMQYLVFLNLFSFSSEGKVYENNVRFVRFVTCAFQDPPFFVEAFQCPNKCRLNHPCLWPASQKPILFTDLKLILYVRIHEVSAALTFHNVQISNVAITSQNNV
jgi:hypothetical protein